MNVDIRYNSIFLYFEEKEHKYTDTLGNEYLSVTTLIGKYHEKFDAKHWARIKAREQGKTERQIIKEWDRIRTEACERGTDKHNGIENAIKDTSQFKEAIRYLTSIESGRCVTVADIPNLIPKPLDIEKFKEATNNKYEEIYRVFDYYTERGYTIYSEIAIFLPDYKISGTIDILCIRDTDFVILDWKTNRDGLKFESGYYRKDKTTIPNQLTNEWIRTDKKMLPPLSHLDDCNGMHYSMQLSLYAIAVEMILGIPFYSHYYQNSTQKEDPDSMHGGDRKVGFNKYFGDKIKEPEEGYEGDASLTEIFSYIESVEVSYEDYYNGMIEDIIENNDWLREFRKLVRECKFGDFSRIDNFGLVNRNGKPNIVVLDPGLTVDVWLKYYRRF